MSKRNSSGYTLLETVVASTISLFFIGSLLLVLTFVQTKETAFQREIAQRIELESAYQTLMRTLRYQARAGSIVIGADQIQFIGVDGAAWSFVKDGSEFSRIRQGQREVLLEDCDTASFSRFNRTILFALSVIPHAEIPPDLDLSVRGQVIVRNE